MQIFLKRANGSALHRWAAAIPLVGAGMTLLLLALIVLLNPVTAQGGAPNQAIAPAQSDIPNRATVVVQFDASARVARSIEFSEPISGLKALELAEVEMITASFSFGDAVCSIGGVGCPADDCFCSTNYWAYSYWDGADWQGYPVGAGSSVISQTGAVEGWRWGAFGDNALVPVTPSLQSLVAFDWLAPRQTITGDFGGVGTTVEMVLAIGANRQYNTRAVDYLAAVGSAYTRSNAAAAGKLAAAMAGVGGCLPAGALTPAAFFSSTLGAYSTQSGVSAWAMIGANAISETIPASAVTYLIAQIQPDGGWEWGPGWGEDTNATALVLQALIAGGEPITSSAVISGLAYLDSVQNTDGGFPYAGGGDATSDVNSTAYVLQGLIAAGEDPRAPRWSASSGNAFDYLVAMQLEDGSFEWQAGTGSNQLATQQAIPALLGQAYPTKRQVLPVCPALYLPLVNRD